MRTSGYFGRALPPPCVDDRDVVDESALLAQRLGVADLWPLRPDIWDEDTFFGLVEVFHDLAVRPRERWMHGYDGCGWHYGSFATDTGRALYRWRVNRLLDSSGVALHLADEGDDTGRLVRVVDDARSNLLQRSLASPDKGVAERVAHAVAMFRAREATEHDKRSATIALVGILEERRPLVRAELGRKDEADLFNIANKFAIRHQNDGQKGDYDQAFLDWIFWVYLGTVELTGSMLARLSTQARRCPAMTGSSSWSCPRSRLTGFPITRALIGSTRRCHAGRILRGGAVSRWSPPARPARTAAPTGARLVWPSWPQRVVAERSTAALRHATSRLTSSTGAAEGFVDS